MRNARLGESQTEIKVAGRNVNNLRYADDPPLIAKNEEKLKSLISVKEESEIDGLILSIQKTKIMTFSPITSWQREENVEAVTDVIS